MEILEYIRHQEAGMRRMVDMTMKDMTAELFNWAAPGTANTISATFIHFVSAEDHFVQGILQDQPRIWDSGGRSEKTGVLKTPGIGDSWDEFKHRQIAFQPLLEYKAAVWAATDAYLAALTAALLHRSQWACGVELKVGDVIAVLVETVDAPRQRVGLALQNG